MQSLVGLSVFLFGSSFGLLLMLALSFGGGYNGLNPLYAIYISMIVIGVGLFAMSGSIVYGLKHQIIVDVPRALIAIVIIGLGSLGFMWSYFTASYVGCPPDGICWSVLQLPFASIILSDFGAILLQTVKKQGVRVKVLATPLPRTQ